MNDENIKDNDEKMMDLKPENYESPEIKICEEMVFPEEVWEQFSGGKWCFGCSNCGCN